MLQHDAITPARRSEVVPRDGGERRRSTVSALTPLGPICVPGLIVKKRLRRLQTAVQYAVHVSRRATANLQLAQSPPTLVNNYDGTSVIFEPQSF